MSCKCQAGLWMLLVFVLGLWLSYKIQLALLIRILPNTFPQFSEYIPDVLNGVLISPRGIKMATGNSITFKALSSDR